MLQLYTWLVKYLDSIYLDKVYLGNICLTEPAGVCLWFPWFNYFFKLLERLQYLILFGTSSQIFGPRYLTDCKPLMNSFHVFSPKFITTGWSATSENPEKPWNCWCPWKCPWIILKTGMVPEKIWSPLKSAFGPKWLFR